LALADTLRAAWQAVLVTLGFRRVDEQQRGTQCAWARDHWHEPEQASRACAGTILNRGGISYCALHFPQRDKEEAFRQALSEKLEAGDYDFRGAWFPDYIVAQDLVSPAVERAGGNGRTVFDKAVNFAGAYLCDGANFAKTDFMDNANFSQAEFSGGADFSEATFQKRARFSGARFTRLSSELSALAQFSRADFRGKADFSRCRCPIEAKFTGASFGVDVDFGESRFDNRVDFSEVAFAEAVRFVGRQDERLFFGPQVVFRQTQVVKPEQFFFHSVRLRPAWLVGANNISSIHFASVEWCGWPMQRNRTLEEESSKIDEPGTGPPTRLIANVCRELALNYETSRQYTEAGRFYYASMYAEQQTLPCYRRPLSLRFWYGILSGYSERPLRAILWLIAFFLVFMLLYTAIDLPGTGPDGQCTALLFSKQQHGKQGKGPSSSIGGCMREAGQAAVYSLGGMVRLASGLITRPPGTIGPATEAPTAVLQFLLILQGILGPLLVALFALAVRRRFLR